MLYLPPQLQGHQLQAQGLVRHALTTTTALCQSRPGEIVVVTPRWARDDITSSLYDLAPATSDRIRVVSPRLAAPSGVIVRAALSRRRPRRVRSPLRLRLPEPLNRAAVAVLSSWLLTMIALLVVLAVVCGLIALIWYLGAIAWLLAAAVAIVAVVAVIALVVQRLMGGRSKRASAKVKARVRQVAPVAGVRVKLSILLERADVSSLVRTANRTGVGAWWMPISLYSGLGRLKGTRVATFADYSPVEFPRMVLEDPAMIARGQEMARCLTSSDAIVCLSEHVRSSHLSVLAPEAAGMVTVIPPGPPLRSARAEPLGDETENLQAVIRELADRFPRSAVRVADWWTEPVLIAPTQGRPYKNLRSLIQAVKLVNTRLGVRARLILTADPFSSGLGQYVQAHRCQAFVEFLPDLSDVALNATLASADLAVSPSLFEGSLPYMLYEAVSVGTPCLLADIPVTREAARDEDEFRELTLFNPHDPRVIADHIVHALSRAGHLLRVQKVFVEQYYRTAGWDVAAERYWETIDRVSSHA